MPFLVTHFADVTAAPNDVGFTLTLTRPRVTDL